MLDLPQCLEPDHTNAPTLRWSVGSVLFLASWAFLMGPYQYAMHLISGPRLPFTAAYFGSIFMTIFFAVGVSPLFLPSISRALNTMHASGCPVSTPFPRLHLMQVISARASLASLHSTHADVLSSAAPINAPHPLLGNHPAVSTGVVPRQLLPNGKHWAALRSSGRRRKNGSLDERLINVNNTDSMASDIYYIMSLNSCFFQTSWPLTTYNPRKHSGLPTRLCFHDTAQGPPETCDSTRRGCRLCSARLV